MFRKAALLAAERGECSEPLRGRGDDFNEALREIVEFGGDLTRHLLGFKSPRATSPNRNGDGTHDGKKP